MCRKIDMTFLQVICALIVSSTPTLAVTSNQTLFSKGSYDISTMMYTSLPEINQPMCRLSCSFACLRSLECNGFKFHESICKLTNHIPVKAIASSANKVELWLSSEAKPVPHFLLISALSGDIYDFSTSESLSLPAVFNATWPIANKAGPFVLSPSGTLRILPMIQGTTKYQVWNIGEPSVTETVIENTSIGLKWTAGWASMDDVMFYIGVGASDNVAWGYANGNWKKLQSFSKSITYTCPVFVPGDTDSVYMMGGSGDASLYRYSFSTNTYSTLDVDNSHKLTFIGCAGYKDAGGKQYFIRVGGSSSGGLLNIVKMFCINCNTPGWTSLPNYPTNIISSSVIEANGILYSFGGAFKGISEPEVPLLKVYSLDLVSPQNWTEVRDLPNEMKRSNAYVVPYP